MDLIIKNSLIAFGKDNKNHGKIFTVFLLYGSFLSSKEIDKKIHLIL
jgi:hypothetical protein